MFRGIFYRFLEQNQPSKTLSRTRVTNKLIVFTFFTIFSCKSGCTYTEVLFVSVAKQALGVVDARFDDRAKILMGKINTFVIHHFYPLKLGHNIKFKLTNEAHSTQLVKIS